MRMKRVFLDKAVVINVQPWRKGVKVISAMLKTAGVVDYDAVFSLNFSSAGKGPFMYGKAKNIYFSKRGGGGGGGGTVE